MCRGLWIDVYLLRGVEMRICQAECRVSAVMGDGDRTSRAVVHSRIAVLRFQKNPEAGG